MKKNLKFLAPALTILLAGCAATVPSGPDLDKLTLEIVKASFRDQGQAKVDRLVQDDANRECSAADVAGKPVYLGLMMNEARELRLKPQNLLLNLPLPALA